MTTYTPIENSEIDQDSVVQPPLMAALRDNPIALAEGASGAPKISTKNLFGAGTSGTVDFDVEDFNGARFFIEAKNASGSFGRDITIGASTDGVVFNSLTLRTVAANESVASSGYYNKINGQVYLTGIITPLVGTFTTIGTTVTTLRFTGATDLTYSIHLMPDGGESSS